MGVIEEKQKIKSSNDRFILSEKKEEKKEKRQTQIIFKKAQWILYDELINNINFDTDLNKLLYDEILKTIIIDNVFEQLGNLYETITDETMEDLNFYLMEIYNTTASKIISIKNKQKKELERVEKEKQKAEYKQQLLQQYDEMMKEQERAKIKAEQEKKDNIVAWIGTFFVILIFAIIIWNTKIFGI